MMTERQIILILTTLINLSLGFAVWYKNPSQSINRFFSVFAVAVGAWTLSIGFVDAYAGTPAGVLWARTAFASSSLVPIAFLLFVTVFPAPSPKRFSPLNRLFLITAGGNVIISFTPLIVRSTASVDGSLTVAYGPLHPVFGAYFISCVLYCMFLLYRKLHSLRGAERLQVCHVLLGVLFPIVAGTTTNLVIPLFIGSSKFSPYGPLFSVLMVALTAHAIIRHRLMNIRLAISRAVALSLSVAVAASSFVALRRSIFPFVTPLGHSTPLVLEVALVLLVAVFFQPMKRGVQLWVDRYFFRKPYDYQRAIREISRTMTSILSLDDLLRYACDAITRTVQPEWISVYTKDVTGTYFTRLIEHRAADTGNSSPETLDGRLHLVAMLWKRRGILIAGELQRLSGREDTRLVTADFKLLSAHAALPLIDDGDLVGFFVLGEKRSGDAYFSEDIDLLATLVSQASVAIKNAQLYSHVVLVNEYIENILGTMESAVIAVSGRGEITLFNAGAERLIYLNAKDVKGAPLSVLPPSVAAPLELTLADRHPQSQVEITIEGRAGHLTPVICSTAPLTDRGGSILGAVAVFSDLTRLKQLEGEKQQAERLASIGALASGVAHEIKNPLVAIKTFAELLPERFADEDFRHDFSKVVVGEIERIDDLISRLRGLAAPTTQPLTSIDLRSPIQETLALLRGQLEQMRIVVDFRADRNVPRIAGNTAQLKQLFLNILVNALEAMKSEGKLSIRMRADQSSGHSTAVVEVADTGTGIPEGLLEKVFDPFVTTKPQGSGLGLSISRGIADTHRATIRARNNKHGSGATLIVEFPAMIDSSAQTRLLAN